jgi:polyisoprenyl-phosphate glycosyltransferase
LNESPCPNVRKYLKSQPRTDDQHGESLRKVRNPGDAKLATVSIIIPAYNEADTLPMLRQRITQTIDAHTEHTFELIIVDDHSSDETDRLLTEWSRSDRRVKIIRFARNAGSHAAWTAGLVRCTGDCAVLMAADLQDSPDTLSDMFTRWREEFDVVWATRSHRPGESLSTRCFSKLYWWIMRCTSIQHGPREGADFVLIDRKVINVYNTIGEKNTSLLSMLMWTGFRQTSIEAVKAARVAGKSKWTLTRKIKLVIDSIVSFSDLPIRMVSIVAAVFVVGAIVLGSTVIASRLLGATLMPTSTAAILCVLLFGFGCVLFALGILGEYLWRTFDQVRDRPRYIIERTANFNRSTAARHHSSEVVTTADDS